MEEENYKMLEDVPDYESIIQRNEEFTDPDFPPTFESIYSKRQTNFVWNKSKFHYKKTKEEFESAVGWIRLSHLFDIKKLKVAERISAKDVKQGALGNDYLIALLSHIAGHHPYHILKLFTTTPP